MGKVIIKIKLTNQADLVLQDLKLLKRKPRTVEAEALVDTGATRLYLKPSVIQALGLKRIDEIQSRTTNGIRQRGVFQPARLEVLGRSGTFDVVDIDEDVPNLLGQIPLEYLDFVVDPQGRKLIPNPEHGDKQMSEEYWERCRHRPIAGNEHHERTKIPKYLDQVPAYRITWFQPADGTPASPRHRRPPGGSIWGVSLGRFP